MPRYKYKNPALQPTEESTATSMDTPTDTATDTSTETPTLPDTYTSTSSQVQHRKRGAQAFEKTHERITLWIDKQLKERFEVLADQQGISKTLLLNEAIGDLLKKHGK